MIWVQVKEHDGRTNELAKEKSMSMETDEKIGAGSVWHTCWRRMGSNQATNAKHATCRTIARQTQAVVFMNQGLLSCPTLRCFNRCWHLIHGAPTVVWYSQILRQFMSLWHDGPSILLVCATVPSVCWPYQSSSSRRFFGRNLPLPAPCLHVLGGKTPFFCFVETFLAAGGAGAAQRNKQLRMELD